jgi:hypothetical protein
MKEKNSTTSKIKDLKTFNDVEEHVKNLMKSMNKIRSARIMQEMEAIQERLKVLTVL